MTVTSNSGETVRTEVVVAVAAAAVRLRPLMVMLSME
jgi:hypothetical protein